MSFRTLPNSGVLPHALYTAEQVRAFDRHGKAFEETIDGMHAVCLQHEMDHLEGKLFVDYLSPLKRRMVTKKLQKQRKVAGQPPDRAVL